MDLKNYKFRNDTCILIGDTHSMNITYDILNIDIPNGNDVIHMGDAGFGFGDISYAVHNTLSWLDRYNKLCQKLDINLYILRGNHDATYDSIWESKWSNVFLIKDFAIGVFPNEKKTLLVGGGISVDRCTRKPNVDYWEDEFTPFIEKVEKCDIMISHDCPEHFNHSTKSLPDKFKWCCERDPTLVDDCLKQRLNMTDIAKRAEVKTIFSGHFHNSIKQEFEGVYYRCLDINERFEFDSRREYKL